MAKKKQSDKEQKRKAFFVRYHQVFVVCGIVGLILPMILYLLFTQYWFPAPNSVLLTIGFIGAFVVGIGALAFFMSLEDIKVACVFLLFFGAVGGVLILIGGLLLYTPEIYRSFDQDVLVFYGISFLFLAFQCFMYAFFRGGVTDWLRNRNISKTRIKKLKKGMQNYWWYETLHRECGLGILYTVNKIFTIVYVCTVFVVLLCGVVRLLAVLAAVLYAVSAVLLGGMSVFASIQSNKQEYGKAFIWLRRRENRGFDSSLIDLAMPLCLFAMAVVYVIGSLDYFRSI